ncbi:dehydrodolichyl diphosphate synthase 2-like [Chenopodium quinoa]|uniref:dehydrodolichyl diphosphate synthase 2-like n=1 Tax=Chenopodium quinoa TaxID=63459 RepID=UPI000B7987B0|nr:dehydrodolichyl diphosphate synthase 2-like [Chenopodium quinoa]
MSILQKLLSMIMAIIPNRILMPFVNMFLGGSILFKDDKANMDGDEELPKELQQELMPRHLAVILDGNRRWAKQRGLNPIDGYLPGVKSLETFLSLCCNWKIPIVSLFVFSTENWLRPKMETDFLLELLEHNLLRISCSYGGRISVIGDTSLLPNSLQKAIQHIEEETKDNTKIHLILAMSYSGQNDIVHACQTIAMKVKDGLLQPNDITKSLFEQHLRTKVTDVPAPDLLIRTSGELRISNYFLWQCAYSEMYFTNTLWPDFGKQEFIEALRSFQQRGRRFGKV